MITKGQIGGIFETNNEKFIKMADIDDLNAEYARIQKSMMEEGGNPSINSSNHQTHSALMAHVMHKRTQSKEMMAKRQAGVRTSYN